MSGQNKLIELLEIQLANFKRLVALPKTERELLAHARTLLNEPLIKVIIGPRRAGKSTFALQLSENTPSAYLNFDDDNLIRYLEKKGTQELLPNLKKVFGKFKILILDEIQNLDRWELFVSRLHREGLNLLITGSNAHLLSQELSTHLTGRFVEMEILPFSWREFKRAKPNASVDDYINLGGFPEVVLGAVSANNYLQTLTDSIILKDIVGRYGVRQPVRLKELWSAISAQFAQKYTISKLAATLDFQSKTTLQNYIQYLSAVFLHIELQRYSSKMKEQLKAPRKSYLIDLGFAAAIPANFDTSARKLENLVLLAVRRECYGTNKSIFYYNTKNGREID